MKRWVFFLAGLSAALMGGCTTSQTFALTDLVSAVGIGLDLASKYGLLASLGVANG